MLDNVLDALSAPRRALWQMIPGLHDSATGDALSGSQVAQNAFGTDPEGIWGKALGLGLETFGDPLPLLSGLATRGAGAGLRALRGVAPAAEAAGGGGRLASAASFLTPASESELSAVGAASRAAHAADELHMDTILGAHPHAGADLLGGTGGSLSRMANKYNANRTMMLDALEDYGPGNSVLNELGLRSDRARLGITKKAINQESMLERAMRGDPRALRGSEKISGMRSQLAELGAPYSQDMARIDRDRLSAFLGGLQPYDASADVASWAEAPMVNFPGVNAVTRRPPLQ